MMRLDLAPVLTKIEKLAMRTTDKLQSFLRVFEIPEFVKPWIDRFFEEIEIDLVMRLENDRGVGWEISKSRAKKIVSLANKRGLMQSGEVGIAEDGSISGAICNCCVDCCYPHKLAEHRNAQNLWPLSRYVARHLEDRCIACGRCAKRCPFQAFTSEKSRAPKAQSKSIQFNENLCRGCGVCSTGCPEEAIEMTVIEYKQSLINEILKK